MKITHINHKHPTCPGITETEYVHDKLLITLYRKGVIDVNDLIFILALDIVGVEL